MFKKWRTKINWRRIFRITLWSLLTAAFLASMGFSDHRRDEMLCKDVIIQFEDSMEHGFVEKSDIAEIISNKSGEVRGTALHNINIALLEKIINNNPFVLNAEVFSTIDGKLYVKVKQRNPIVRIINAWNESYYLDDQGVFMPVSDKYAARVLVANGNIFNRETEQKIRLITEEQKQDTSFHPTLIEKVYMMADYLRHHDFWNAQIEQVYVNENAEMELIPRVGGHTIVFGDEKEMDEKFNKLFVFYKEGLSKTGWNQYKTINLTFKDQVVCTKN